MFNSNIRILILISVVFLLSVVLIMPNVSRAESHSPIPFTNLVPYIGANEDLDLGIHNLKVANSLGIGINRILSFGNDGELILAGDTVYSAILNWSNLNNTDKTFTFPNTSGTFNLLEANQTLTGLNKFEASSNSTVYIGSSVKSGCVVIGDSDNDGFTYLIANDGVLSATSEKPSICK